MLSLKPVIQLLTPKPVGFERLWFRNVGGAAEYAQIINEIDNGRLPLPQAWVVRADDPAKPVGRSESDMVVNFDVVIGVENVRGREQGETDDTLILYRQAVRRLLQGYDGLGGVKPVSWHGGAVVDYVHCGLFYRDRYCAYAVVDNFKDDPDDRFLNLVRSGYDPV